MMSEFLTEVNSVLVSQQAYFLLRASKLKIPAHPLDIYRACQLLGHLIDNRLSFKVELELERLLGTLPINAEEARLWKSSLRALLKR